MITGIFLISIYLYISVTEKYEKVINKTFKIKIIYMRLKFCGWSRMKYKLQGKEKGYRIFDC